MMRSYGIVVSLSRPGKGGGWHKKMTPFRGIEDTGVPTPFCYRAGMRVENLH